MSSQTILILGAGGNTGVAVAKKFKEQGWRVATASRSAAKDPLSQHTSLHIQADFANPSSVVDAYRRVEQELGIPNVVIYNGKQRKNLPISVLPPFLLLVVKTKASIRSNIPQGSKARI